MSQPSRNRAGNAAFCRLSLEPAFLRERRTFFAFIKKKTFAENRDNVSHHEDILCAESCRTHNDEIVNTNMVVRPATWHHFVVKGYISALFMYVNLVKVTQNGKAS